MLFLDKDIGDMQEIATSMEDKPRSHAFEVKNEARQRSNTSLKK